jgi:hypothetical protein
VIDLRSRDMLHSVWIERVVSEFYDVRALPGVARPMAFGFKTDEIEWMLTIKDEGALPT